MRPGAEEKASGAKGRMLESKNTVQQVANYKRFVLGQLDVFDQDRAAADHAEFRANFCFWGKERGYLASWPLRTVCGLHQLLVGVQMLGPVDGWRRCNDQRRRQRPIAAAA